MDSEKLICAKNYEPAGALSARISRAGFFDIKQLESGSSVPKITSLRVHCRLGSAEPAFLT